HQYLRVGFEEMPVAPIASAGGVPVVREFRRVYHVASEEHPLFVDVEGPAWLRVDELRDGVTIGRYVEVPAGETNVKIRPEPGQGLAMFRVFERALGPERLPIRRLKVETELARFEEPPKPEIGEAPVAVEAESSDEDLELDGLRRDTWSFGVNYRRRKAIEEDAAGNLKPDEFFELAVDHRLRFESLSTWVRSTGRVRGRVDAGPSIGLDEKIFVRPPSWRDISLVGDARFALHWPDGDLVSPTGDAEWAGFFRLRASQLREINSKWSHRPEIGVFGRLLSVDNGSPEAVSVVDQDVFTGFKGDHRAGLVLSESLSYRPWLDSRLSARVDLRSNEDFQFYLPDHVAFRFGAAQRLGPFEFEGVFRLIQFFEDDDRGRARRSHIVGVRGASDLWLTRSRRIEILADWYLDIDRRDTSFVIGVIIHLGHRSGFRDFAPDELGFRGLRRSWMLRRTRLGGLR
ncbi:MAG: hypothetical protein AAF517_20770, partial [Planctomycetota bacterium]